MVRTVVWLIAFSCGAMTCASPVTGWARDIFVNNELGDDQSDGGSADAGDAAGSPVRSIRRALVLAGPGDRIILAKTSQPYRESVTLQGPRHSGIALRPFTIIGNGAILDGREAVPQTAWRSAGNELFRFEPNRRSFGLLYVGDVPAKVPEKRSPAGLEPLESVLFQGQYYFRPEPGRIPPQYDLSVTFRPVGITLYEVRDVKIEDLVVQGYQLDGISAADSAFGVRLVGVTARGNGRSGVHVAGASRVRMEGCLVGNNGTSQLRTEGWCRVEVDNCDLVDSTAPAIAREGGRVDIVGAPASQ